MSKIRIWSTEWAGTEARDTAPSPRGECSRNGGGCERAPVTVGCDKRKVSVVGCGLRTKRLKTPYPRRGDFAFVTKSPLPPSI